MSGGIAGVLRRLRVGKPVVVVSGLPRSGTSMAMKMLEAGGLEVVTDGVRTADVDNPKGYYEDERVKDLAKAEDRGWLRGSRGKAIKIISFLLKDLPEENDYKVVFMERDLDEVLASQQKMLDHREEAAGPEDEEMAKIYVEHLRHVKFMVGYRRHFDTLFLNYRAALADPAAAAARINAFLGGGLDERRMAEVVDPDLYRNRA
ncbi:MAG: sulfotransferase family protein [Thermoanaerobaculia bacterium]|nr:sulfotransferase family protein [Thermoanaerobaculia bacterium]